MKRFLLAAALLAACQPAQTGTQDAGEPEITAGVVGLRLNTPVSEPFACIFPIRIENGLNDSTSVTMIAFKVTGPGEDANGNMFAPPAEAGQASEARVIVEGQSCEAFDTLSIPEIRCTSGEQDCSADVELIDGGGLRFARTG